MPAAKVIYLGIKGSVIAVDVATGVALWSRHLKGSSFVNVVLEGDNVLAATYGEIFCLDARSGQVRWHNPLKGYGLGLVSIATAGNPGGSQLILAAQKAQEEAEAASASSAATSAATIG